MPTGYLEHANLTVSDPEATAALLEKLCGWTTRWSGPAMNDGFTVHCGDERAYVALYTNPSVSGEVAKGAPLNHVGIAVDDLDAAERVVIEAGFAPFNKGTYDPGPRSFYFYDTDRIEWEIVSYE